MALHWIIPFKSRLGSNYTLRIYDDNYSDQAVKLIGGSNPFTTQENDDEDEFVPLRTQSGYIRIVDNGKDANGNIFNWKSLIPQSATGRPVELVNGSVVVWAGFMQPQTFGGRLYGNPQEREFPVYCPLTAIDGFDLNPNDADTTSFAYLLYHILDTTDRSIISNLYFQGGAVVESWLLKQTTWINFADMNDEGEMEAKYSRLSVLRDVCRFFGWTCRMHGRDVYFTSADDSVSSAFYRIDMQSLYALATGGEPQSDIVSYTELALSGRIYASIEQQDEVLQGIRKAKIVANINKLDFIFEVPYALIYDRYKTNDIVRTEYGTETTKYLFTKKAAEANAHTLKFGNLKINFTEGGSFVTEYQYRVNFFASEHIYEYYENLLIRKHSYNFTTNLYIIGQARLTYDGDFIAPLMSISTLSPYSFSNGMLVISARTYVDALDNQNDDKHVTYVGIGWIFMALKIGDKYWQGDDNWSTERTVFYVLCGTEGGSVGDMGTGQILSNQTLEDEYPDYNGFGIEIVDVAGGPVTLEIFGWNDSANPFTYGGTRGLNIEDLKVEFLRPNSASDDYDRDSNEYMANGSGNFSGEIEEDLIFASDSNNQYGTGIIMNEDGSYCQTIEYANGEEDHPEQHKVNRMAAFGSSVRRLVKTEMLKEGTNVSSISPRTKCTLDGTRFHPIAINHEWRDDVEGITMIEV